VKIGRYQIIEEIGRGSMGVVYKAHDPNLAIDLALKVLRKDRISNEPFLRRFIAEARALGRLDHPEIVRVYNVDREGDDVYIAMEYIVGTPFSKVMKETTFAAAAVADFAMHMARALGYAHQKGIVHRDVKPGNIICTADGGIKITDFGIARIEDPAGAEETLAGEILGTPAYMSPEQVLGRTVDGRSDLFSLGIILYEMATGSRPFQGDGLSAIFSAITSSDPAPVSALNPAIPRPLSDAIMKCLARDPKARYQDGGELAAAVAAALAPDLPPVVRRRSPLLPAAVASAAVLALAVAFLLWRHDPTPASPRAATAAPPAVQAAVPVTSSLLKAETVPAGATIELDGAARGVTPASLTLAPGKHELVLNLAGYQKWEAQVELDHETELPVTVSLTPVRKVP
jgi:eukaryotic-like serine/threonine-protein kinase